MKNTLVSAVFLLVLFGLLRGVLLPFPDLIDPTETRYALIAKHLTQQDSWIMPEIDRGDGFIPFWGKPPLQFWLTAFFMEQFSNTEVAARLVSFISGVLTLFFTYLAAVNCYSKSVGILSVAILGSSLTFFVMSGSSTIDPLLMLSITGAISCMIASIKKSSLAYGLAGFVFAAAAMMTKGPIGVIFIFAPIFGWAVLRRSASELKSLPWVSGSIIFSVLVLPWFCFAEKNSPGFLRYFFVNEHFLRFLTKNYGDRYGSSHPSFKGKILLLAFAGFLPWSLAFLPKFSGITFRWFKEIISRSEDLLLLLWTFTSLIFFCAAGTVLFTYALPAFPPAAILLARLIDSNQKREIFSYCKFMQYFSVTVIFSNLVVALLLGYNVALLPFLVAIVSAVIVVSYQRDLIVRAAYLWIVAIVGLIACFNEPISQNFSTLELLDFASRSDPDFQPVFVGKIPYSATFSEHKPRVLKRISYEELATIETPTGDFIFQSLKKVDPKFLAKAKTTCQFGKWSYLDMSQEWKSRNSSQFYCRNPNNTLGE